MAVDIYCYYVAHYFDMVKDKAVLCTTINRALQIHKTDELVPGHRYSYLVKFLLDHNLVLTASCISELNSSTSPETLNM
jgi:hypothetical protein